MINSVNGQTLYSKVMKAGEMECCMNGDIIIDREVG